MNRLDANYTQQLARDFNEFYLKITAKEMNQIGNYRIIEEIGEGSFGKVYLAIHIILDVPVVLKSGLIDDPNIVREIFYHKQLKHKNIVRLYEVIRTETRFWLVMEYCQGNELYYYIYENRKFELKQARLVFFQIINAVKYVHSLNLAHRDLKLENILFADKKRSIIKLTDFGFVREFNPAKRKLLSTICGTTVYMAPEVLKNEKYNAFTTDIWSLGVILYTMLYGQMPFDEDDDLKTKYKIINEEPQYFESVPPHAISLVQKMLNKNPMLRPNLNEILNSEFLIDITNKFPSNNKRHSSMTNDTDTILSINQYFNSGLPPFQSKLVKNLLKKLEKIGCNVSELQQDIMNNEMNSLTAFYELVLVREFMRKKKRYYRDKRRRAKRSLNKSRKRVKSVLLLSEENSQPLERIMSSLSLNSRGQNHSRTNLTSLAGRRSVDSKRRSFMDAEPNTPPANRTISFQQEKERQPSLSSGLSSASERRNRRNNKLINRLQFWKKKEEYASDTSSSNGTSKPRSEGKEKDQMSELTVNSPSPKTVQGDHDYGTVKMLPNDDPQKEKLESRKETLEMLEAPSTNSNNGTVTNQSGSPINSLRQGESALRMRTRPSSMISQISQLTQLSTMMSESELEILESDSMDDFEEEMYESSSMNTSMHEVSMSAPSGRYSIASTSNISRGPGSRPSYRRQVSSDVSIASTSTTNNMSRQPSVGPPRQDKKSSLLIQVSSNSSDESSDIISPIATAKYDPQLKLLNGNSNPRPLGPMFADTAIPSPRNTSPLAPSNVPRSSSPPVPNKSTQSLMPKQQPQDKSRPYKKPAVINEEENEDDTSL